MSEAILRRIELLLLEIRDLHIESNEMAKESIQTMRDVKAGNLKLGVDDELKKLMEDMKDE